MILFGGKEESVFKISLAGRHLEHISELKYLEFELGDSCIDGAECYRKVDDVRKATSMNL